jgi:hypothetical protein
MGGPAMASRSTPRTPTAENAANAMAGTSRYLELRELTMSRMRGLASTAMDATRSSARPSQRQGALPCAGSQSISMAAAVSEYPSTAKVCASASRAGTITSAPSST